MKTNTNIKYKKQKGQTLLFVIVAVTIAMAVGVSVSTRTIQSLKRVARTDTSARVIAAAEGGIENLLSKTYKDLDAFIVESDPATKCGNIGATPEPVGECSYVFTGGTEDLISSRAVVKVETFNSNEANKGYSFTLEPGSLKEVNLDGYTSSNIKICWENPQTAIYYLSYNSNGDVRKGGIKPLSGFSYAGSVSDLFDSTGVASVFDYTWCKDVSLVDGSRFGLRIKVLYNDSKVAVFPVGVSELELQGYKFTSRGEIVTGTGSEEKATVIVHKSLPYAPDIFDYGIYTPKTLSGSN